MSIPWEQARDEWAKRKIIAGQRSTARYMGNQGSHHGEEE